MVDSEASTRGRPRTADGRRMLVSARVNERQFAAIEAARGGKPRSEWVEAAINAYLSPVIRELADGPAASPVPVYGYAGESGEAESVYGNDEPREDPPCRHPSDQVDPDAGVCHECGAEVW